MTNDLYFFSVFFLLFYFFHQRCETSRCFELIGPFIQRDFNVKKLTIKPSVTSDSRPASARTHTHTHTFTLSLTHTLTHSLTHSVTHSLSHTHTSKLTFML